MPTYHTPAAAAAIVGVSVSSLRNWCATFADYLSEGARPPAGTERKLIAQDIAILQRVKELRAQGMTTDEIKATLSTEDTSTLQPYVDSVTAPQATVTPPEPPQAIELYSAILSHTAALQARMDAQQAQIDAQARADRDKVTLIGIGFLAGVIVCLFVLGALWLGQ